MKIPAVHPGDAVAHHAEDLVLDRDVGQLVLDEGVIADGLPFTFRLDHVLHQLIDQPLVGGCSADHRALEVQRHDELVPTVVFLPNQAVLRDAHVVEEDLVE